MSHSYSDGKAINASLNQVFSDVLAARLSRRDLLKGAAAWAVVSALPLSLAGCASGGLKRTGTLGFKSVPLSTADAVRVPEGYSATVLLSWGDPIGHPSGAPAFKQDASNTAAEFHCKISMRFHNIF